MKSISGYHFKLKYEYKFGSLKNHGRMDGIVDIVDEDEGRERERERNLCINFEHQRNFVDVVLYMVHLQAAIIKLYIYIYMNLSFDILNCSYCDSCVYN